MATTGVINLRVPMDRVYLGVGPPPPARPHIRYYHFMAKPTFRSDGNFAIHVTDLGKALTFYRDVMGFELLESSSTSLAFDTGSFNLFVNLDTEVMPYIPAFAVASLTEAVAHLKLECVETIREFDGAAYFKDPFGIVFDIIEKDSRN